MTARAAMGRAVAPPRLPWVALALCGGCALAPLTGPFALAPWCFGALALAVASLGRGALAWGGCALLCGAALFAAWAQRDARLPQLPPTAVADDRAVDTLVGNVAGAVEDRPGRRRFNLALASPAAATVRVSTSMSVDVLPGDRVRVRGRLRTPRGYRNPGGTDVARVARRRGYQLVAFAKAPDVEVLERGRGLRALATRWQRALSRRIAHRVGGEAGGVLRAMVLGDRGALPAAVADRFRAAGLAHVLAVSGLHLAVTAFLVFAAARRLWALVPAASRRVDAARAAAVVALPVAVVFTLATGARVSTTRALVAASVVLVGAALGRRGDPVAALALAAIAIVGCDPPAVFDPGFQLSFGATAALLAWTRSRPRGRGRTRRALDALALGAVLAVVTAPLAGAHFGVVAFGGALANVAAVPLVELVILPLALLGLAVGAAWPALGAALLAGAGWSTRALIELAAQVGGALPPQPVSPGAAAAVAAALVAGAAVLAWGRQVEASPRATRVIAAALSVAVAVVGFGARAVVPAKPAGVRIWFFDVGQGDAALVQMPDGEAWLFDAGGLPFVAGSGDLAPAEARRRAELPATLGVLPALRALGVDRLATVVVSHPHPDHYLGLGAVARAVAIDRVWVAADHAEAPWPAPFSSLLASLARRGTIVEVPPPGAEIRSDGVRVDVLAPRYRDRTASDPVHSLNDNSLVVALAYAGRRVLFSGDLEREGEAMLGARARADVVKVPHHGSKTSSTPGFIAAAGARVAVISCGFDNRFGFPAASVEARWRRSGARVFRTDLHGAVRVDIGPDGNLRAAGLDRAEAATPAPRSN